MGDDESNGQVETYFLMLSSGPRVLSSFRLALLFSRVLHVERGCHHSILSSAPSRRFGTSEEPPWRQKFVSPTSVMLNAVVLVVFGAVSREFWSRIRKVALYTSHASSPQHRSRTTSPFPNPGSRQRSIHHQSRLRFPESRCIRLPHHPQLPSPGTRQESMGRRRYRVMPRLWRDGVPKTGGERVFGELGG